MPAFLKYLRAARQASADTKCNIRNLISGYRRWASFLNQDGSMLLEKETPWITFSAIDFLTGKITKDWQVFEFGGGASTVFWARRARAVVTVEHDREWYNSVIAELEKRKFTNVRVKLAEPEPDPLFHTFSPSDPADYISGNPYYDGNRFEKYARSIEEYPPSSFSLVAVDGRARPSCLVAGIGRVQLHGFLLLDNSDRERYAEAMSAVPANFVRKDFPGPSPLVDFFTRTTIWQRVE